MVGLLMAKPGMQKVCSMVSRSVARSPAHSAPSKRSHVASGLKFTHCSSSHESVVQSLSSSHSSSVLHSGGGGPASTPMSGGVPESTLPSGRVPMSAMPASMTMSPSSGTSASPWDHVAVEEDGAVREDHVTVAGFEAM